MREKSKIQISRSNFTLSYRHDGQKNMAEKRTTTISLPQEILDELAKKGGTTVGIIETVKELKTIKAVATSEIRGLFTPDEWKFLADSLNGTMTLDSFRYSKEALCYHNEDSETYEGTATKWHVSLEELNNKIKKLSGTNICAIYERVESFWNDPKRDLLKWSIF